MRKIGFLVYDISLTGGAEKVALNMAEEFNTAYDVHMISLFDQKNFDKSSVAYKCYILSEKTISITANIFKLRNKLRNILKDKGIDILFIITAGVVTVGVMAAVGLNTKTVYCEHSNLENKTYGNKHQLRQFIGATYSDAVVTLTERDRKNFLRKYKISQNKVFAIPNWFTFRENLERRDYDISSKRIITAGRLEYVKGYDLLLKIASVVKKSCPDWSWDIYGEGSYREKIEEWIAEYDLSGFVSLMGNVNNLQEKYKDYAFFVMTSYYEGLPLVLLEAQTSALPIISFDCPTGPSEIVRDGVNGYLIENYNTDEMAKTIVEFIKNDNLRKEFSSHTMDGIQRFSKETVLKFWIELINKLI